MPKNNERKRVKSRFRWKWWNPFTGASSCMWSSHGYFRHWTTYWRSSILFHVMSTEYNCVI